MGAELGGKIFGPGAGAVVEQPDAEIGVIEGKGADDGALEDVARLVVGGYEDICRA